MRQEYCISCFDNSGKLVPVSEISRKFRLCIDCFVEGGNIKKAGCGKVIAKIASLTAMTHIFHQAADNPDLYETFYQVRQLGTGRCMGIDIKSSGITAVRLAVKAHGYCNRYGISIKTVAKEGTLWIRWKLPTAPMKEAHQAVVTSMPPRRSGPPPQRKQASA